MNTNRRVRLSYANVVSSLALFAALGGSAYASGLINGAKIKNGTIAGQKLKAHTLTATQINMGKLGTVPNAAALGGLGPSAFLSATGTAANASKLSGQPASAFLSATGTATDSSKLGGQPASAFLSATGTAADSSKLGGLTPSQLLHGSSLTGSATFLASSSGPVLTIPGVGTVGASCSSASGTYNWTFSTTAADTYAVMPVTLADGFFPVQTRYDDTDSSNTYYPKLLDSAHTVTLHGGVGPGSTGFVDSEGMVELVPVGGWNGTPVTLLLTGVSSYPQNTCAVTAYAQLWG